MYINMVGVQLSTKCTIEVSEQLYYAPIDGVRYFLSCSANM